MKEAKSSNKHTAEEINQSSELDSDMTDFGTLRWNLKHDKYGNDSKGKGGVTTLKY